MSLCSVILSFLPAFFHPLDTSIILLSEPYIEFNDVSVWYFRETDTNSTQILANGIDFSVPMTVQEVSRSFPADLFIGGRSISKFQGVRQTNYVFIRKDHIKSIRYGIGRRVTITLNALMSNHPIEKVRLVRLNKEK